MKGRVLKKPVHLSLLPVVAIDAAEPDVKAVCS